MISPDDAPMLTMSNNEADTVALAKRILGRLLSAAEFQHLADVPAAAEWFANIDNPNTRRAYQNALADFMMT